LKPGRRIGRPAKLDGRAAAADAAVCPAGLRLVQCGSRRRRLVPGQRAGHQVAVKANLRASPCRGKRDRNARIGTGSGPITSLSKSLRLLEEHLRTPLFDRSARGVVLTEMGQAFYRRARNIQAEWD